MQALSNYQSFSSTGLISPQKWFTLGKLPRGKRSHLPNPFSVASQIKLPVTHSFSEVNTLKCGITDFMDHIFIDLEMRVLEGNLFVDGWADLKPSYPLKFKNYYLFFPLFFKIVIEPSFSCALFFIQKQWVQKVGDFEFFLEGFRGNIQTTFCR